MKVIKVTEEQYEAIVAAGDVLRDLSNRYFTDAYLSRVSERREAQLMLQRDPKEILDRVFEHVLDLDAASVILVALLALRRERAGI